MICNLAKIQFAINLQNIGVGLKSIRQLGGANFNIVVYTMHI